MRLARTALLSVAAIALAACSSPAATPTVPPTKAPGRPTPTPVGSPTTAWTFKTGGAIWGSASIKDGTLYIGSNDGKLYALDAATGQLDWKFETGGAIRTKPAFSGANVLVSSDDGNVYAVAADSGKKAWQTDIHNDLPRPDLTAPAEAYDFDFLASSPVVADGTVFAGSSDGNVYALDAAAGKVRWTFKTGDKVRATPAVSGGLVYVGSWDGEFYALKAAGGELAWKYRGGDTTEPRYLYQPIQSTAVVSDGIVYGASRMTKLFALDAATGQEKWQASNGSGNWYESSPVVAGERLYIGSSAAATLFALDRKKGFSTGAVFVGGFAWSTPLIDGEMAYIGSEIGVGGDPVGLNAIALDGMGSPQARSWIFPISTSLDPSTYTGVNSSPVISGRTLYFGGLDGVVYALNV